MYKFSLQFFHHQFIIHFSISKPGGVFQTSKNYSLLDHPDANKNRIISLHTYILRTMTTGQNIIYATRYIPIVIYLDKDLDTIDQFQLIEMGRALCYYIKRGLWYLNRMFFNGPFKSGMMMEFEYFFYFDTQFALAVKCIDIISFELFCSFGGLLLLCYCNATTPCFFLFSALLL